MAKKTKAKWEASGRYGPYTVFAGTLTQVAKAVSQFTLKPI